MSKLISVVGKMHSGKTTFANALQKHGFTRFAFADPVKEGSGVMLAALYDYLGIEHETFDFNWIDANKGHPAIRQLAQLTGDELGRQFIGPDTIWIDRFQKRVEKHCGNLTEDTTDIALNARTYYQEVRIINDDCRYPNEADRLQDMGFFIIKLQRDEQERIDSIRAALAAKNPELTPEQVGRKMEDMAKHGSETNVDKIQPHIVVPSVSVQGLQEIAEWVASDDFNEEEFINSFVIIGAIEDTVAHYFGKPLKYGGSHAQSNLRPRI